MKRSYAAELLELPATYRTVVEADVGESVANVVRVQRPMLYVGSGGALAVARLAAELHTRSTGELAVAATPLEAATSALAPTTGVVLFSARGRHPDAAMAINSSRARGAAHLGVVSARTRAELPPSLAADDVRVATVPASPDGFLATNSLLAMATAVCLAHDVELPAMLPAFLPLESPSLRRSCLVVTGPGTAAVGVDLEARLVETGLATVQLTDYRNLAHGRHVGLVRNLDSTTLIGIVEPSSAAIADRTLALLPPTVDLVQLRSELPWPSSVLDLLVQSMYLVATAGKERGVDPGRPGVQTFGRRLYHLPVTKLLSGPAPDPVVRKLAAPNASARVVFESALEDWMEVARGTVIGGVVLDYDGTCCPTWDRYRPPPGAVQDQIVRLLEAGLAVGFATGRGRSLHDSTRSWLPEKYWAQVHVGLYNGTQLLRLADDPSDSSGCDGILAAAADRLEGLGMCDQLVVERRRTQVSISTPDGRLSGTQLLPLVRSVLSRPPFLLCKSLVSGHSVDVIAPDVGKTAVLESVTNATTGAVLAIGDQGQLDGNDFELLAATSVSLSVDQCSADPTRCWNLDRRGQRGPELLVRYLKALQPRSSGVRFVWKDR
ncbi:MAG TPA: hypothetical protein PK020_17135 [Ilumatobacteraceae bacterium]|nr:hypothetical protein [Ilumatobacteraceae bacterium]